MAAAVQYQPLPAGAMVVGQALQPSRWSNGLCACCNDCGTCLWTCCCSCVAFGQAKSKFDRSNCPLDCLVSLCCLPCCECSLRGDVRKRHAIPGSDCGDCLVSFICPCCALCQTISEINRRAAMPGGVPMVVTGGVPMGMGPPQPQQQQPQMM